MSAAIYWIHGRTNRLGPSFAQVSRCLGHSPLCRPQKINASRASTLACSGYWKHYLLQPLPHLSRTQSYSNKPTNVFTMNASINMLRKRISFSGTPGGIGTSSQNQSVVPIGIIPTKNNKGHNLNIVVVPMDLSNMTYNDFKHMMQSLNVLRSCADQVESLTAEMLEHNEATDEKSTAPIVEELEETNEQPFWETAATTDKIDAVGKSTQIVVPNELQQAAAIAQASLGSSSEWSPLPSDLPPAPRVSPAAMSSTAPQTQPDLPLPEYNETPQPTYAATQQNLLQLEQDECTDKPVSIELPKNLETRLKELAISSMQLSFEMDMSNIKNALAPKAGNAKNSLLMETEVNMQEDKVPAKTIPLAFNALIQGTVEVDASKMYVDNLAPEDVSDFNDNVTAIAANICSTALEQGFPSELSTNMDMTLRQNPTVASKTNEHVKCIATKEKGCISPGNAHLPFYDPKEQQEDADSKSKACSSRITAQARMALKRRQIQKHMKCEQTKPKQLDIENDFSTMRPALNDNGCKHRVIKKKKKCPKKCPLDEPCEEKEKPCIEKKQPKKKAASTTEITASKKGDAKKDAAGKGGGDKGGKAGGDKKKEDPCAKFKKGGKGDGGKDGGRKGKGGKDGGKGDGGKDGKGKGGKDGGDKKNDPCAKFKKGGKGDGGKDGKGKGGKEGGDKKNDPCAKFKKGGKADGGKDGKGKGGKDGGGKKEDPCAKFKKGGKGKGGKDGKDKDGKDGGDKKKDPCAKFKKGGKADGGKDGKGKGGKDGGDKKKDPCAKFKKGGKADGGKDGKGKGGKDGGDKKEDPCAKLKKGGGKGDGGKDGKGKGGKEGGDKKKKDPCAKFKKGGKRDGGKDGKGGKDGADKKKKDPCAKFKKGGKSGKDGGKGKGGKDANRKGGKDGGKTDPCKKKFSTFGRPSFLVYSTKVRRHYSALPVKSHRSKLVEPMTPTQQTGPRFLIYSTLIRRHYAKKADKSGGKCSAMAPKYPKNRKNQKERTGLRTDCFKDEKGEGCPKPLRSKKPKCDKVKVRRPKCDRSKNKKKSKRSNKFKKSKQSKRPTDKGRRK